MDDERKQVVGRQKQGLNGVVRIEAGNSKSIDGLEAGVLKSRPKKSAGSSGADGNSLLRTKRVEVCFSPVQSPPKRGEIQTLRFGLIEKFGNLQQMLLNIGYQ